MSALDEQVGGDHYKNHKIQPMQLAYMLGQTPAFCKVAKYCTRVKDDPIQQYEKAKHCIRFEQEMLEYLCHYQKVPITVAENTINEFTNNSKLARCLTHLHMGHYNHAIRLIDSMINEERENRNDK